MARRKKTKVRTKRVVKRVSGGRRSGAGRKSIEVHFAALSDLLNERFSQLFAALGKELPTPLPPERDVAEAPEAPAPEEKPRKRRLKIADDAPKAEAAPQPVPEAPAPVPAPIPAPVVVAPVAHSASPEVVAPPNPWAVPGPSAPAPASTPENGANSFESQFAALNKS